MASEIKMPQLSDTMHAGKILGWSKKEGDTINRGDILAEVETDKANLEIESFFSGVLLKVFVPAGSTAKVGDVIAVIGQANESVSVPAAAAPAGVIAVQTPPITLSKEIAAVTNGAASSSSSPAVAAPTQSTGGRIKASPLARKLAAQMNVDISTITGSGPDGRIVRRDVEASPASTAPAARSTPVSSLATASTADTERRADRASTVSAPPPEGRLTPLSKMRETIARRMQEAITTAPHFYVTTSVNMSAAKALREALKQRQDFEGISINHLVMKASAYALAREPRVNRAYRDGQMYEPGQINIGVITAVEDGLLIPVVRDANKLSLRDLVFETRATIERARRGRPGPSDLVGGTFSISNLGMYDVESFTAIINPGQGAVLAVSSIIDEPIAHNGQIAIAAMMRATLSVDHRVIDGVMAGSFLKFFKEGLELPALLMEGAA